MTSIRAALAATVMLMVPASTHAEVPVDLEADTVVIQDGIAQGLGPVDIRWGQHQLQVDGCRFDTNTGRMILGPGTWLGASGQGSFGAAQLDLVEGGGRLTEGTMTGADGAPQASVRQLEWEADGLLRGSSVTFTPCGCERPPWSVSARRVWAKTDEQAAFTGGVLRVCDTPVLPLPAGIVPLKPRKGGLLPPRIGYGQDGLIVAQPMFVPLGQAADATVTPEWRQHRLGRIMGEARVQPSSGPLSVLGGAIGRDEWERDNRGMVTAQHATSSGLTRVAVDSTWTSDRRYLSDYGDDFLTRSAPWTETLAVAGVGPVRMESDTFQSTDSVGQRPLGGVLSVPGIAMGPVTADAMARIDTVNAGREPWLRPSSAERIAAAAVVGGGQHLGPLHAEARAEGRVTGWSGSEAWQEGRLGAALRLPLWADVGALRHVADVGVAARTAGVVGRPVVRLPEDQPDPTVGVGPELRSQWLASDGVPVAMTLSAPWTSDGWDPAAGTRAQVDAWGARAAGSRMLQDAATWWDDGRLRLGVGLAHYRTLVQGTGDVAWTLPAPLDEWRPGYLALNDFAGKRLLRHGPTLGFESRCDCLRLSASAEWSVDRPIPDAMIRLDLR